MGKHRLGRAGMLIVTRYNTIADAPRKHITHFPVNLGQNNTLNLIVCKRCYEINDRMVLLSVLYEIQSL